MPSNIPPYHPEHSFQAVCIAAQSNKIPEGAFDYKISPLNIIVEGPVGVGKSSLFELLAKAAFNADGGFVDERVSLWDLSSDRIPFPGDERFYTYQYPEWCKDLIENWNPETQDGSFLVLDEILQGSNAVIKRALGILQERKVGSLKLPREMSIVALCNPTNVAVGTFDLSSPAANRFCFFNWGWSNQSFVRGMKFGWSLPEVPVLPNLWWEKIPEWRARVGTFLERKPELQHIQPTDPAEMGSAFPTDRTWECVSTVMAAADSVGKARELRRLLISGCVGSSAAIEFITFLEYYDLVDPAEYVITGCFILPDEPDKKYAAVNSIITYCVSKKNKQAFERGVELLQMLIKSGFSDLAASQGMVLYGPRNSNARELKIDFLEGTSGEVYEVLHDAYKESGIL